MRILSTSIYANHCKACKKWLTHDYEFVDNLHLSCIREMSIIRIYMPSVMKSGIQLTENNFISAAEIKEKGKNPYSWNNTPLGLWGQDWRDWIREYEEDYRLRTELEERKREAEREYYIYLKEVLELTAVQIWEMEGRSDEHWVDQEVDQGGQLINFRGARIFVTPEARQGQVTFTHRNYADFYYRMMRQPFRPLTVRGSVEFLYVDTDSHIRAPPATAKPVKKKERSKRSKVTKRDNQLSKLLEVRPFTVADKKK